MKQLLHAAFLLSCLVLANRGFGQGELPVDMYTGSPIIEVPIWTVKGHDLVDPIRLSYKAKGVQLDETNGQFGVSWSLQAGGEISREVRGLPDDFTGTGTDRRRGWLYLKYASATEYNNAEASSMSNTADLSSVTCSDEQTDWNKIWGYGYDNDTEPDIFHYNVGGISGSFVFDNTSAATIRLIPYRDVVIVPTFASGSKAIGSFTITTSTGVVYTFGNGQTESESRYTEKLTSESTVEFLKTDYELYAKTSDHGATAVSYTKKWKLGTVTSPSGDVLTYAYQSQAFTNSETIKAYIKNYSSSGFSTHSIYSDNRTGNILNLSHIFVKSGAELKTAMSFATTNGLISSIEIRDFRRNPALNPAPIIKQFNITYQYSGSRAFIREIQEVSGTESLPPYRFDYNSAYLPSGDSFSKDFWGYYNGRTNTHLAPKMYVYPSLPPSERYRIEQIAGYSGTVYTLAGADRTVNPDYVQAGTLKTISYPWGGMTTLTYESNTYYDSVANQSYKGGGLRIKKVVYEDGLNPDTKIIKTLVYEDGSNKSFGRLISKPTFAIPTYEYRDPLSTNEVSLMIDEPVESDWNFQTVRSEIDLSSNEFTQGSAIGYQEVKVYRPGAGYVHFEYKIRAGYGFENVGDWTATMNKFVRGSACPALKIATALAGANTFPYVRNPNFDYERGLLKRKREYNELGQLVSENIPAYKDLYKTGTTPHKVWGVDFEQYPNSDVLTYFYGKYFLLTDVIKVLVGDTTKLYDPGNQAQKLVSITEYSYGSPYHKLLTKSKNTSPDGIITQTYIKYPLDYGAIPSGADKACETIGTMQSTGRIGIPIETYQTITRPGGSEMVVSGSIVKFNDFGTVGKVLPEYTLSWNSATPKLLTQFVTSYVHPSTKQFTTDILYESSSRILSYGEYDMPTRAVGNSRIEDLVIFGYNATVPILTTSDVTPSQFAFSDFEETTQVSFSAVSTSTEPECVGGPQVCVYYIAGRTGAKSIGGMDLLLSKTLEKNSNKYTLSAWVKHMGTSAPINVKIQNSGKTITYFNQALTFTPTTPSGSFEYVEFEIPIDPSLTTFYVAISISEGIYLDDVGFYPSHTSLTTYTYTFPFGVNSVSNRHKTSVTEYDALGRVKYLKDKDGNILQKKTYQFNAN
ncbi:MAG TPA: hypothetical protein VGD65_03245 [Chryseosolibacter sp.]